MLLTLSLLASLLANVATQDSAAVYGDDTRLDLEDLTDADFAQRVAASSAAQIPLAMIEVEEPTGLLRFGDRRLGEAYNLCDDEAFYDQLAIAMCSGTLIAPNLLLTAGHCVDTEPRCDELGWVFGFDNHVSEGTKRLHREDLYTCHAVHALRFEREYDLDWDYAVVELDRPVRAPYAAASLAPNHTDRVSREPLFVVSYPSGLPLKVDLDAYVTHVRNIERDYFTLMADTFSGSSGGGVFTADSGELVGILVRTAGNYVRDTQNRCYRVLSLDENAPWSGFYESASYADTAIEAFCATTFGQEQPLCQAEPETPTPPLPDENADLMVVGGGGGCDVGGGLVPAAVTWGWCVALGVVIRRRPRRR